MSTPECYWDPEARYHRAPRSLIHAALVPTDDGSSRPMERTGGRRSPRAQFFRGITTRPQSLRRWRLPPRRAGTAKIGCPTAEDAVN
jgi:hypothetical protein